MTGKLEPVIFRNETPAPTEPGWYYGIDDDYPEDGIRPEEVVLLCGVLRVFHHEYDFDLAEYRWFGPVPAVREG